MAYIYLPATIFFEVVGTTFLKAANGFTVLGPSLAVVAGYIGTFYFLSLSLTVIPLGVAYAVWAGLGIVLISLSGYFVYGQKLDFAAVAGLVMIVGGVVIIKAFSKII